MTHSNFLKRLQIAVAQAGSQTALAKQLGISPSLVSMVLAQRWEPPPKLLRAMGYRRVVSYERVS